MIHVRVGRQHFTLAKQEAFIKGHGQQCLIAPVMQCPCLLDDRQFDPNCPTCLGTGRFYPPGASYTTTLLVHQEDAERTFQEPGSWTSGTVRAAILPGLRLCERDKVRFLAIKDVFSDEVLTRGIDDTVRFQHGVELLVVADRQRVYRPQTDYTLLAPATVWWSGTGQQPEFGFQYAVKYAAEPEFLVVDDNPRLRVEANIPQAQEVVLCRLDRLMPEGP